MPLLSSPQFVEWMAFYQVDPFGGVRGDVQAGVISSTLANIHRDTKKRSKPYGVADFLPFDEKPKKDPIRDLRTYLKGLKKDGQ